VRRVPPRFGCDANGGIDIARAKAAGVSFVARFHSDDGYPRNLTPAEARAWANTRTDLVSCWQNGKSEEVLEGYDSGVRCAGVAKYQQQECGGAGQPVYFAVDFWLKPEQRAAVVDFFRGARKVLGLARLGAYGPSPVMDLLFGANAITYGWHSGLFRPGEPWHPRAQLRQVENTDLSGRDDFGTPGYLAYDHMLAMDAGQWRPTS
jgi:hypothetical protein